MNGRRQERRQITMAMVKTGLDALYASDYGSDMPNGSDEQIVKSIFLAMMAESLLLTESNSADDLRRI